MQSTDSTSRRQFIETSSATVVGSLLSAGICPAVHAARKTLRRV